MNEDQVALTGEQLQKLAKDKISDKVLMAAFKDKYFREFIRISLLMQQAAMISVQETTFGHSLTGYGPKGDVVAVQIEVQMHPRTIQRQ